MAWAAAPHPCPSADGLGLCGVPTACGTHPPPTRPGPAVLTAAALPAAPPVWGRLCPAAPSPRQVLAAGLGEGPHLRPVIDTWGAQSVKSACVRVAGEEAAARRRCGPAEDVGDAVGGAGGQLGAQPRGPQLVEGALHRVLADGRLGLREGAQRGAVEQEGARQVGVHDSGAQAALRVRVPWGATASPFPPARGLPGPGVRPGWRAPGWPRDPVRDPVRGGRAGTGRSRARAPADPAAVAPAAGTQLGLGKSQHFSDKDEVY